MLGVIYHKLFVGHREDPISLLVERIGDVIDVPRDQIEASPVLIEGMDVSYVREVRKPPGKLLIILDGTALG